MPYKVRRAAADDGFEYVRSLVQQRSTRAESELLDVCQIPDAQRPMYQRNRMQPQYAKYAFPAWSKSALAARTCPGGVAWRVLSRRIARVAAEGGAAKHDMLVALRRWRPPMLYMHSDSPPADAVSIQLAARTQRRFWRRVRPADLQYVDVEPLRLAAESIANQLDRRHQQIHSRGWQRWCRTSVTHGGSAVIQWVKRPETELQSDDMLAPTPKLF